MQNPFLKEISEKILLEVSESETTNPMDSNAIVIDYDVLRGIIEKNLGTEGVLDE